MSGLLKRISFWEFWWRSPPPSAIAVIRLAAKFWPLVVLAVGVALYLPFLDLRPFRFEEGRRALLALEMLDGHAWWRLKVLGEAYTNKPPFTPWLISAVAFLRGSVDEIAVRLPGVIFALAGALAAGIAASGLVTEDRKVAGLSAGLAFLCSIYLLLKTRVGETDVTATALCGLAFAIWILGRRENRISALHWAAIAVCFACEALTKGPIPIAFPALPMIVIPLLQRRPREAFTACAVIVAAHIPLVLWAWSNLASTTAEHWVYEMRLGPADAGIRWTRSLRLNDFPLTVLYLMPFLPAAVAMAFARAELPRERRWIVDALLLYAVPMTLVTTIIPMGKARYAMPAAWPIAVLAGMWVSMKWRQLYSANFVIGFGLATAIVIQIVQIGVLDGRTSGQRALRARAEQFSAALAGLPPGPLPLLWRDFDYNLLAYAGRRLFLLQPSEIDCRTGSDYLVAGRSDAEAVKASPGWAEFAPLSDWGLVFRRVPGAPVRDCVPALRP